MELSSNKNVDLKHSRYPEVLQAAETSSAELKATVERAQSSAEENAESLARLKTRTDTIELSTGATVFEADRSERIAELRASVEDGSLFDRERLERAAERLLSKE
ncbi:MAG: hypothetical protein ACJAZN_002377 [Planctomycetota bacterium]|jgi:hypothetical protein